jgi:DnaK suppressor protein
MPVHLTEAPSLPHWRALLEARWRARLQELTELSLAYHDTAAAAGVHQRDDAAARRLREALRAAVAARRGLADTEEALARLAVGRFGRCEQCGKAIPVARLALAPETRYCPPCEQPPHDRG